MAELLIGLTFVVVLILLMNLLFDKLWINVIVSISNFSLYIIAYLITYISNGTWECSLESVIEPVIVSEFDVVSSFVVEGQTCMLLLVLANVIISFNILLWSDSGLNNSFCFGALLSMLH